MSYTIFMQGMQSFSLHSSGTGWGASRQQYFILPLESKKLFKQTPHYVLMAEKRDEQTVKDFAGYIVKRAKEITHYNQKLNERVNKSVVYSVGTGSLLATIPFFGNPLYHLSGLAASAVGSAVDKYSTMIAARQMDKKFHEYGFGRHYWETGKMMPKHPTDEYYTKPSAKALARTLGIVSLGAFVPSVGYAQIAQAPVE